ncbi:MAG: cytochrome c-type biogenesis protein CcmH [Alphaproteobacteria bacterium]|nr:cytochrome c-type biogenesis protein CcmH [Alphaproteobacteria bacterium]
MKNILIYLFLCLVCSPSFADDTASVEIEAREIAEQFRCLACNDENVEKATDEIAHDIRIFIRKHLAEGKDAEFIKSLIEAQYGDMISDEEATVPNTSNEIYVILISVLFSLFSITYFLLHHIKIPDTNLPLSSAVKILQTSDED